MNLFYKQHFPILFVLTSFIGMSVLSNAQSDSKSIWKEITEKQIARTTEQTTKPSKFRLLRLDVQAMKSLLQTAPLEKAERNSDLGIEIHLPMPDGSFSRFRIYETYVMHPDLAAKFPEIKTYAGQGIDDVNATIRLDVTPFGFHSMVLSPNGSVFIDPYSPNSTSDYICYYKKDLQPSSRFICELRTNNDVDITGTLFRRNFMPRELPEHSFVHTGLPLLLQENILPLRAARFRVL